MTIRTIRTFPDELLRRRAKPVKQFDHELRNLVDDMIETMRVAPGVGLAAPQIGISQQLIVVEFGHEDDESIPKQLYVLANPEIIEQSEETEEGIEGCLSVPNLVGVVERATVITVKGQNQHGHKVKIRAQGWLARIFQHEIDHLNGVLYIDHSEQIWQPDPEDSARI